MHQLAQFSAASLDAVFCPPDQVREIHETLTSTAYKQSYARRLISDIRQLYVIPDSDVDAIVAGLADPSTRRATEHAFGKYPFRNPATQWAATGYSLVMDRIFAEDSGSTYVVAVPAQWSLDLWHSERDLGDDGYSYQHWVYATLPATYDYDRPDPVAYALVSDDVYGTLHWGGSMIRLYRGEITVVDDPFSRYCTDLLGTCAAAPVTAVS